MISRRTHEVGSRGKLNWRALCKRGARDCTRASTVGACGLHGCLWQFRDDIDERYISDFQPL